MRPGRRPLVAVERRLLVRVLAVAQVLHLVRLQVEAVGERRRGAVGAARREPVRDRAVVRRRVRERLRRQREARRRATARRRPRAARRARPRSRRDRRRCRRAASSSPRRGPSSARRCRCSRSRRRACSRARDRLAERVEVDDDEVDRRDAVRRERRDVRRQVAAREDAAVHLRMQRLHAAVEHLREPGVVADLGDRQPGAGERLRRAAGGQQPHAEARRARARIRRGRSCRRPTAALA